MAKCSLLWIFLLLLAGTFSSCMTEEKLAQRETFSPAVTDAQRWYNKQVEKDEGVRIITPDGKMQHPLYPDWRQTFSEENEQYRFLGVDLSNTIRQTHKNSKKEDGMEEKRLMIETISITAPESGAKFREVGDRRYLANSLRLIIRTNKETNEKHGFVMIVVPDLSYLEMNLDNPFKDFTYLKHGEGFSGFVQYYEMDGTYTNGWRFIEGKAYKIVQRELNTDETIGNKRVSFD